MAATAQSGKRYGTVSERQQRRSEAMLRRTLRWVWAAGLLPFVAVAALFLKQSPEPVRLRPSASASFVAPLGGIIAATDRAGVHVAVITGDADVQLVRLRDGQLLSTTIDLPWTYQRAGGTMLQWVDANFDQLVDLRATPWLDEQMLSRLASEGADDYRPPSYEYRQENGHFRLVDRQCPAPEHLERKNVADVNVGAAVYRLDLDSNWRQSSSLQGPRGGRQSLAGVGQQVADLNGDGCDEILTCEDATEDIQIRLTYRVYSYIGKQFREVWKFESLLPENDLTFAGDSVPMVVFVDLDSDGTDEVLCGEASTGRVQVLRWQDPPLEG